MFLWNAPKQNFVPKLSAAVYLKLKNIHSAASVEPRLYCPIGRTATIHGLEPDLDFNVPGTELTQSPVAHFQTSSMMDSDGDAGWFSVDLKTEVAPEGPTAFPPTEKFSAINVRKETRRPVISLWRRREGGSRTRSPVTAQTRKIRPKLIIQVSFTPAVFFKVLCCITEIWRF